MTEPMARTGAATATRPADAVTVEGGPSASALANSQFRLLFLGNIAVMMGFGMMQVAQSALAFDLTGRNSAVGFVAMGMGIPMLLLGPLGGALSDRWSKRTMLAFGQVAVGAVFFGIGIMAAADALTIWLLAGLTLLMGSCFAVLMPARQAWVGDLLQGPALANGVALQQLTMNATRIVGPLAAGGMIAVAAIGVGGTYMVMGTFFAMATGLVLLMAPTRARADRGDTSVLGDLRVGLSYTWRKHDVRLLMLTFAGVVLSAFTYQQLMPGFLENELGQPSNRMGLLFGTTAVGGILFTLLLVRKNMMGDPLRLMYFSGWALAVSIVILAVSPNFIFALCAGPLVGAASTGFQMCNQVNLMQRTDPAYFGRVMSLTMTAFGTQMIVGFPAGALADAAGERATLVILAVVSAAVVTVGFAASRSLRRPAGAQ
ncbi:MAG: MFS transporter [Dehalococcoidia bacterium]|nr:MFS transporter [Dehalococcoidia bacterium]